MGPSVVCILSAKALQREFNITSTGYYIFFKNMVTKRHLCWVWLIFHLIHSYFPSSNFHIALICIIRT